MLSLINPASVEISCGSLILLNTTYTPTNQCNNAEFALLIYNEILQNFASHGINTYIIDNIIYFDCPNISVTTSSNAYLATSTSIDTKNLGLAQTERNIFGSSRKGIDKTNKTLSEGYYFGPSPNFTKYDEAIPLAYIFDSDFMPSNFQIYIDGESVLNTPYTGLGGGTYLDFTNDMASDINQYSNEYNASVKTDTQGKCFLRIWPKSITKFKTNSNYITYTQNGVAFANSLPTQFTELSKHQRELGNKSFELTNHLGNVNAVISDRIKYGNLIFHNNFNLDAGNFNVADWTTENSCTNLSINGGNLQSNNTSCGSEYNTTLELTNKFIVGQAYTVEYTATNTPVAKIKNDGIYENVTNNSITFIAKSTDIDILFTYEYQGSKTFEISNLKIYQAKSADVLAYYDYYPFGMIMPNRSYTSQSYRYGFSGHEKDDEIKGSGNHLAFGDYGYDPRLGKRLNVDPMTRLMPDWSPYSYGKNNPILYIDVDGQFPFTFFVRSYESSGIFATPFTSLGDGRVASTSESASARIHFKMDIETDGNKLMKYDAFSSPTVQLHYPIAPFLNPQVDRAVPEYSASPDGKGGYSFNASASEPVMSKLPVVGVLTPDIDIKGGISATVKDNILSITGQIKGDGFPDAETFIKDNSDQSLMLGTYNHGSLGSPLWSLPGDGNQEMMNLNIQVKLDDNGNFGSAWSIDGDGNKTQLDIIAPEKKE